MDVIWVYMTCKDGDEAKRIGSALIEQRLVACVNIWEGMQSMYWWKGNVETDNEVVMIAKTQRIHLTAVQHEVERLHSYEVPCIIALPVEAGNLPYISWIKESTT